MTSRLQERVAVVVGGTRGIGRAIALRLAQEGARVVATGSRGQPDDPVQSGIAFMPCDLLEPASADALARACQARFGRVDILVNNAGISIGSQRLHETSLEDWQRLMDVNLRGVFLGMKAFLPLMLLARAGCIINLGSTSAFRGTPGAGAYCASKAAIVQLTRVAALEYVGDGIRVNAVCPGTVRSQMLDNVTPERIGPLLARIPMGRFAEPEEVAALVAFLASDDAAYITGQGYVLDGGRFAA